MKICPRCQKTYTDDSLNFCLEDGSVLTQAAAQPPPTVMINQPQVTQPQPSMPNQPGSQPGMQPAWNTAPQQYSMQPPRKSSKTWIWVLLILGLLALLCGGGFIGFLAYLGSQADSVSNVNSSNNSKTSPTPNGTKSGTNSTSSSTGRTNLQTVDLSRLVSKNTLFGTTELIDGELVMGSNKKDFYFAIVAPADYKTEKANTRVTVSNIDDANSRLGYGLIFHSNPSPLQQDYAFLIDAKNKKYRVVHHAPQKETPDINWTTSDAIKNGTDENVLEVRDLSDKIELYINGTMVKSITNAYGYSGGVAGLYSGDGIKVAFKDLEIRK